MAERKLTFLGKLVVLIFIAGCFYGAYALFIKGGSKAPSAPQTTQNATQQQQQQSAAAPAASQSPHAGVVPVPSSNTLRKDVLGDIRRRDQLVVAYEGDSPPMYMVGANNSMDGFEYRLALKLASLLGVKNIKFVQGEYSMLPDLVKNGTADVIIAGYIPDPAASGVEWSESYLDFGLCLVVLKSSAINDPKHLAGKTVAVYDDQAAINWVQENIPGAIIKTYSGEKGWFEAVENREADALVYDYPFVATEIKQHPKTHIVKFNLNSTYYSVGVPAANDQLLDAVNSALKQIKDSQEYANNIMKYLDYQSEAVTKPIMGKNTYTVKAGDTLSKIAAARLGSRDKWTDLYALNKDRIPNPHLIHPGYVLVMP